MAPWIHYGFHQICEYDDDDDDDGGMYHLVNANLNIRQ
jgi:hypothetical protein